MKKIIAWFFGLRVPMDRRDATLMIREYYDSLEALWGAKDQLGTPGMEDKFDRAGIAQYKILNALSNKH